MLQVTEVEGLKALTLVTFFCELIFTHKNGFKIVYQPHPMDGNIADPVLTLSCLDCSLSMQPIWKSFPSVILTSGTISPINLYPKILGFEPVIAKSINIQIGRNPINPLIIGRTFDQEPLSS
jgi:DNA excision repair protein ERCC-2